jgi:hypothetical protein
MPASGICSRFPPGLSLHEEQTMKETNCNYRIGRRSALAACNHDQFAIQISRTHR